ncbi:MAG: lipoyl protein ligase domain-containing protein, partial [Lacipirellulaceae bacterium]
TSDLAVRNAGGLRKVSGNSLRIARERLVYHGTLLYGMDLTIVGRLLRHPPREPDYRGRRPHGEFLVNLPLTREQVVGAVRAAFPADRAPRETLEWFADSATRLALEKFSAPPWKVL